MLFLILAEPKPFSNKEPNHPFTKHLKYFPLLIYLTKMHHVYILTEFNKIACLQHFCAHRNDLIMQRLDHKIILNLSNCNYASNYAI